MHRLALPLLAALGCAAAPVPGFLMDGRFRDSLASWGSNEAPNRVSWQASPAAVLAVPAAPATAPILVQRTGTAPYGRVLAFRGRAQLRHGLARLEAHLAFYDAAHRYLPPDVVVATWTDTVASTQTMTVLPRARARFFSLYLRAVPGPGPDTAVVTDLRVTPH